MRSARAGEELPLRMRVDGRLRRDCAAPEIPAARLLDRYRCPSPALEASLKPTLSEQKSTFSKTSYRFLLGRLFDYREMPGQRVASRAMFLSDLENVLFWKQQFGKCVFLHRRFLHVPDFVHYFTISKTGAEGSRKRGRRNVRRPLGETFSPPATFRILRNCRW